MTTTAKLAALTVRYFRCDRVDGVWKWIEVSKREYGLLLVAMTEYPASFELLKVARVG